MTAKLKNPVEMLDEASELHGFVVRMVKLLMADGYDASSISLALITVGVSVAEAKMHKDQAIAHLRDLLSDIAGLQ